MNRSYFLGWKTVRCWGLGKSGNEKRVYYRNNKKTSKIFRSYLKTYQSYLKHTGGKNRRKASERSTTPRDRRTVNSLSVCTTSEDTLQQTSIVKMAPDLYHHIIRTPDCTEHLQLDVDNCVFKVLFCRCNLDKADTSHRPDDFLPCILGCITSWEEIEYVVWSRIMVTLWEF